MKKQVTYSILATVFFLALASTGFGQFTGKAGGSATPFFDTNPFGGQIGHLNSGTYGTFNAGDAWIGIGRPSFGGVALPNYGMRIQEGKQGATVSLNDNLGNGTKDFELQWGPDDNSKYRLNFIKDPSNPAAIINLMTGTAKSRIGINQDNPDYTLDVFTTGDAISIQGVNVGNNSTGVRGQGSTNGVAGVVSPSSSGSVGFASSGVSGTNNAGGSFVARGVFGSANNNSNISQGVVGSGVSSTSLAYGGSFSGNSNSSTAYGIFASAFTSSGTAYAGFFNGNVQINGTLTVTSDARLKKDVKSETNVMDRLLQLRPTTYTFREDGMAANMNLSRGMQHGFIAQEMEQVFPELVQKAVQANFDEKGNQESVEYKTVNYLNLIPVLTAGIQEQQGQLDVQDALLQAQQAENDALRSELAELKNRLAALEGNVSDKSAGNVLGQTGTVLYQNTPNPFDRETSIRYSIADNAQSAEMLVFDMNGRQMKAFTNLKPGENVITLQASELEAGMYFYTMIVDGKEVATKRMILTK